MSFLKLDTRDLVESFVIGDELVHEHYLHSPDHDLLTSKGWKFEKSPGEYVHDKTPAVISYYPSEKKHRVSARRYGGFSKAKKPKNFASAHDAHEHAMSLAQK